MVVGITIFPNLRSDRPRRCDGDFHFHRRLHASSAFSDARPRSANTFTVVLGLLDLKYAAHQTSAFHQFPKVIRL
jgi:hypothetical protein